MTDHTDAVTSVAFSPDGKWLATGSYDQPVIVWDAGRSASEQRAPPRKAAVLRGHRGKVGAVAFSPDGRWLASASDADWRTIVWDVGRWEKVRELPIGIGYSNLLFSPNGLWLMRPDGQTWDLTTGQQVADEVPLGGNWAVLSPDGTRMVNVNGEGVVAFWDLTRRKPLGRHRVHQDHGRAVAYSPDGRLVATGAEDIVLWDAATQTKLLRPEHAAIVWSLEFSPDGRRLVSTHGDGAILVWDVAERERVANLNEHSGGVRAVEFSPDGKRVASASEDRSVIIWDAESGRKEAVLIGHTTRVTAVAFSPDGKWIASTDQDAVVIVWDLAERQPRWIHEYKTAKGERMASYCLAISPDGRWVVTTDGVYESATGRQVVDFLVAHPASLIYGAAFSADGRWLAWATEHGHLLLWDTANWQLLDQQVVSNTHLISVSFSPDGKWLATGEDEGAVRLWQTNPLRQVAVIGGHAARIKSVAFSPDGREVASASDDRTMALWDVRQQQLITRIGTHTAPVLSVAWSPTGKQLAVGGHDKSVRIYTRHRTLWGRRLE